MFLIVAEAVFTALRTASLNEFGELPTSSITFTTDWSAIAGPLSSQASYPLPGQAKRDSRAVFALAGSGKALVRIARDSA
jgi:hypothetical protein